jgi:acetyl-CoA carboxylase biotin carboxyl carrier protein
MKVKEIIELVDFISKKRLEEVKIETEEIKLSIKKSASQNRVVEQTVVHAAPAVAPVAAPLPAPVTPPPVLVSEVDSSSKPTTPAATTIAKDNLVAVKSPMIGTFYRSVNPESPFFANIGDKVEVGQTVCIIEAMKLFNEIETEVSGTIVKVMVENAQPVEYDQVLFMVDPS